MRLGVFGIEHNTLRKLGLGLLVLLHSIIGIAAIVIGLGIFRIDLNGLVEVKTR